MRTSKQVFWILGYLVVLFGNWHNVAAQSGTPSGLYGSFGLEYDAGFHAIGFPVLSHPDMWVDTRLPGAPAGTKVHKFVENDFVTAVREGETWNPSDLVLNFGEGFILETPEGEAFDSFFGGEIIFGGIENPIPEGLSMRSSIALIEGGVTSDLNLRLNPFDNLYQWNGDRYDTFTYLPDGTWHPREPVLGEFEAVFLRASAATNWFQTFPEEDEQ